MSEILGLLFAIAVGVMGFPKVAAWMEHSNENSTLMATAQQQIQLDVAASAYIQTNYAALQAATGAPNPPAIITVGMLQSTGYLPPSFNAVNPYGQTWQIEVNQPAPPNLQSLSMSTGGTPLLDKQASKLASLVGSAGGFIPQNDSGAYAVGFAYGTAGGWKIPTTNYSNIVGGHPAALLAFSQGQTGNTLYRNAVPGQPTLNAMNTPLVMNAVVPLGGACSQNGSVAQDGTGAILSCQALTWAKVGGGGAPPPPTGTGLAAIATPLNGEIISCTQKTGTYTGTTVFATVINGVFYVGYRGIYYSYGPFNGWYPNHYSGMNASLAGVQYNSVGSSVDYCQTHSYWY